MLISQLMEKTEAGAYRLLTLLKASPLPLSSKQLHQETDLSRATILKYLDYLQEALEGDNLPKIITLGDDYYQLEIKPDQDWALVLKTLLSSSIKYQILVHLLDYPYFSISQLCQQVAISEATLHRHLAGLNDLLVEFDISIYNGQWKGPEHQIRYFYWLLLQQTKSLKELELTLENADLDKEIQVLERLFQHPLRDHARQGLALWSWISRKRWGRGQVETGQLSQALAPYKSNIFFQRLERSCLRYFSRYAVELDESEAQALFAFLVSTNSLPAHTVSFLLGFGGPIAERMTSSIQKLRQENICGQDLPGVVTETFSWIFHRHYFFKGSIWHFPEEYRWDKAYFANLIDAAMLNQAQEILTKKKANNQLEEELNWHLLNLLSFLNKTPQNSIRIGLDISGGQLEYEMVKTCLEVELTHNRLIELLPYHEDETYDGLISHQLLNRQLICPTYRLNSPLFQSELPKLTTWILSLLSLKQSL